MKKVLASLSAFLLVAVAVGGMQASADTSTAAVGSAALISADQPLKVNISRGGEAIIEGTVVGSNGSELIVRSWGGDWRVLAHSGTRLERHDGSTGNGSHFAAGDSVRVEGKATGDGLNVVHADRVKNRTKHSGGAVLNSAPVTFSDAVITRVDPSDKAFWVNQDGHNMRVSADERTRFVFGDRAGGLGDLKPGMRVNLGGLGASDNSNVLALTVSARDINVINNRGNNSSARVDQSATDNSANDSNNSTDIRTDNSDRSTTDASDSSVTDSNNRADNRTDNSIEDSGNSEEETDLLGD